MNFNLVYIITVCKTKENDYVSIINNNTFSLTTCTSVQTVRVLVYSKSVDLAGPNASPAGPDLGRILSTGRAKQFLNSLAIRAGSSFL